jgi:hypothetical protein
MISTCFPSPRGRGGGGSAPCGSVYNRYDTNTYTYGENTVQETTHPLWSLYLEVVLWVPVAVEDDDGVGGGEIDAQAARPRRQQEAEVLRAGRVEVIDRVLPQLALYSAVQPLERESPQLCAIAARSQ